MRCFRCGLLLPQAITAAVLLMAAATVAPAATLTVCNRLPEVITGVRLVGTGTPDAAASEGVLAPGACAVFSGTGAESYAVHYILGRGDRVMLCSVEIAGAASLDITARTESHCIR